MESSKDHWYETLSPGTVLSLPDIDCSAERIARHSDLFNAYHPVNTSSDNRFGRAIAHGPHPVTQAMASVGDLVGAGLVAMSQLGPWRFLRPAFVGDRLTADASVIDRTAATRGSGTIVLEIRVTNPDGKISQIGEAHLLVRQRPNREEAS